GINSVKREEKRRFQRSLQTKKHKNAFPQEFRNEFSRSDRGAQRTSQSCFNNHRYWLSQSVAGELRAEKALPDPCSMKLRSKCNRSQVRSMPLPHVGHRVRSEANGS